MRKTILIAKEHNSCKYLPKQNTGQKANKQHQKIPKYGFIIKDLEVRSRKANREEVSVIENLPIAFKGKKMAS